MINPFIAILQGNDMVVAGVLRESVKASVEKSNFIKDILSMSKVISLTLIGYYSRNARNRHTEIRRRWRSSFIRIHSFIIFLLSVFTCPRLQQHFPQPQAPIRP